jgi:hypothetical protein
MLNRLHGEKKVYGILNIVFVTVNLGAMVMIKPERVREMLIAIERIMGG